MTVKPKYFTTIHLLHWASFVTIDKNWNPNKSPLSTVWSADSEKLGRDGIYAVCSCSRYHTSDICIILGIQYHFLLLFTIASAEWARCKAWPCNCATTFIEGHKTLLHALTLAACSRPELRHKETKFPEHGAGSCSWGSPLSWPWCTSVAGQLEAGSWQLVALSWAELATATTSGQHQPAQSV